jgi:hypothetical protein
MSIYAKELVYIVNTGNIGFDELKVREDVLPVVQAWLTDKEDEHDDENVRFFTEVIISSNGSLYKVFSPRMVDDNSNFPYIQQGMITVIDKTAMQYRCTEPNYKIKNYATITYEQNEEVFFNIPEEAKGDLVQGLA